MITYLEPHDRINPLWLALEKHLEERLAQLRTANDNPTLTDVETHVIRGRISEVKAMLGMGKEQPEFQ